MADQSQELDAPKAKLERQTAPELLALRAKHVEQKHTILQEFAGRVDEVSEEGHFVHLLSGENWQEELVATLLPEVVGASNMPDAQEGDTFYWLIYQDATGETGYEISFTEPRIFTPEELEGAHKEAAELAIRLGWETET